MDRRQERGTFFFADRSNEDPSKQEDVFFNPQMRTNRDISELAVEIFREGLEDEVRMLDATAGSGIRGLRCAPHVDELHLSDPNPSAVASINMALEENGLEAIVHEEDANHVMSNMRNYFHIIDVDPFGPFTKFLDSAARAANHCSLVGLTATDNSATSGSYSKVCRRRYGSRPLRNSFMHETGLRIYIKGDV
jgi:N2,N2-dimethylguanosine tRNA methyltransferase